LTERHAAQIADWKIRIFDYAKSTEPFRNRIRANAEQMAADAGIHVGA